MPKPLSKNLNFCLAKIKRPPSPSYHPHHPNRSFFSNPPSSLFPFFKNFNSLYGLTFDRTTATPKIPFHSAPPDDHSSSDSDPDDSLSSTPDLATVFASQRFFFSSPGRSNSIIDSSSSSISSIASSSSSPADPPEPRNLVAGGVPVPTYSPDPFVDFRRSMQEMVEAHELVDWDFLQELLMCYVSLNPKSTHKFILGAFADLLVSLMTPAPVSESRRSNLSDEGGRMVSRRCM